MNLPENGIRIVDIKPGLFTKKFGGGQSRPESVRDRDSSKFRSVFTSIQIWAIDSFQQIEYSQ